MALDLIAPVVPNAQESKAPELFLQGMTGGLAAFARFAQMQREQETDLLKLAAQERIAQDEHAVQREKIYKDTEYQDKLLQAHATYYNAAGEALTKKAEAYARGVQGMVNQDGEKSDFLQRFRDRTDELKLNDPQFEVDDPGQFYLNVKELRRQYGTSTMQPVQKALGAYWNQARNHVLQLPSVARDEHGTPTIVGGKQSNVPIGQIIEGLHDPATRQDWIDRLQMGGHITPGKKGVVKKGWFGIDALGGSKAPDTPTTYDETAQGLLDKEGSADYGGAPPVIQPDLNKKARDFRALPVPSDAALPTDSSNTGLTPDASADTSIDPQALLQGGLKAIQMGADPKAVAARLQNQWGIDPSLMWA